MVRFKTSLVFPSLAFTTGSIFLLIGALVWLSGCQVKPPISVEDEVAAMGPIDFNFHVKPILSQNCFLCHGNDPESRKAKLRLDLAESAFALRDSAAAIVPGDPSASLLVQRIYHQDPDELMPPPESHKTLSDRDKAILKKWIAEGAEYKPHWAFTAPTQPEPPTIDDAQWANNAIDHFIKAGLQNEGLSASEEADRRTLIRRVAFDLTGLPPSPEEVNDFLADDSPEAYENMVDYFLASPHFGERMTQEWLDVARYADTNGYSIDGGRHMWLWRDWVIQAFNQNMPFDQFVTEQLAGDLMADPTEAQLIATGFNRNHMITHEGGTIPEENLVNYVADRVKTFSETFLGLTFACAQCHDHKFDPISQREYYQLYAFFNTVSDVGLDGDRGINSRPSMEAHTPLLAEQEIAELQEELAQLRAELEGPNEAQDAWETAQREHLATRGQNFALHSVEGIKVTTPNQGFFGEVDAEGRVVIENPGWLAGYNVSVKMDGAAIQAPVTGIRITFEPHEVADGKIGHGKKEGMEGSFVMTSLTVSHGELPSDQVDLYKILPFSQVTASTSHPDFPTIDVYDERRQNGWSPHPANDAAQHFTATFATPIDASETPYLTAMVNFGQGDNLIAGNFRIWAMTGMDDGTNLSQEVQDALATSADERSAKQAETIEAAFRQSAPATALLRHQIANLEERLQVLSEPHPVMVMDEAPEPRRTYVLNRGQYDQPLDEVSPAPPAMLPALPDEASANRLGLAQWLTRPDHPLTARVAVNRYWKMLFGRGIVPTEADFGSQGAAPSHPALLDWLAVEFINSGWDVKGMMKTIMMSATYRQSSDTTPALMEQDPENVWLARGPRFRLQGEFIRDHALQVSGLMVDRIGGPSVRPYQPAGLWKEVSHYGSTPATAQVFVQDHGEKLYRRSMYTYWKRTSPPPSMMTFDAPNREVCTITREVTNTPLQALVLLNDPQFVEASRAFAERIMNEADGGIDARIRFAFEAALSREPDGQEMRIAKKRYLEERDHYREHPEEALEYLSIGEHPRNASLEPADHAAWTAVATLILNLSETITRG